MDGIDGSLLAHNASTRGAFTVAQQLDAQVRIDVFILSAVLLSVYWYYKCVTINNGPLFHIPRLDAWINGIRQHRPEGIIFIGNEDIHGARDGEELPAIDDDDGPEDDPIGEATIDIENVALFVSYILLLVLYSTRQLLRYFANLEVGLDITILGIIKPLFWQSVSSVEFWVLMAATIHNFGEYWFYYYGDEPGLLEDSIYQILELFFGTLALVVKSIDDLIVYLAEVGRRYYDEQETKEEADRDAHDAIR